MDYRNDPRKTAAGSPNQEPSGESKRSKSEMDSPGFEPGASRRLASLADHRNRTAMVPIANLVPCTNCGVP